MSSLTAYKLSMEELEANIDHILASPKDEGIIEMILIRPAVDQRQEVEEAVIDQVVGVVGDNWKTRGSKSTTDGSADPDAQVTIMNSRVIDLLAQEKSRWRLAGDQFYIDFDLSQENLPPGQQIQLGTAVLEVSPSPHQGCAKFSARFGKDAHKFVNNRRGSEHRLRGVNMKVVQPGTVRVGERVKKL